MRFSFILVFTVAVAWITASGAANAKYSLCNKTSYTLSAAIGYVDAERLATRGWWRLRPGQCKVVLTEKTNPGRYFVYAEAIPGHQGDLRTWSGDKPLCVENGGFFNLRNQEVCRDTPSAQRNFFDVEVTPAANGDWQTDFAEASNFTVYSAEVAGVQRLLRDVGHEVSRIDGSLGRQTRAALAAYRKSKGFSQEAKIDDQLIDALIDEANARDEKRGFFFCNKTGAPVWSAIGAPGANEAYDSKGWWRLEPGACSKVLKGELEADHYYVYGLVEEPDGNERRLAGGDKKLCVNPVRFDVSNASPCEDQELEEAVFKRVNVGGAPGATFDFLPDMFVAPPAQP